MSALLVPFVLASVAGGPAFAWLGEKTWYEATQPGEPGYEFRSPIQAEWLFPIQLAGQGIEVTPGVAMGGPGVLILRIWARDRDYWTATDVSNHACLTGQPRAGYEYDRVKARWVAGNGCFMENWQGVYQSLLTAPLTPLTATYVAVRPNGVPLFPNETDTITVTVDDEGLSGRNDDALTHPDLPRLNIHITGTLGRWTIRNITTSDWPDDALTTAAGTSGWNYPNDNAQKAYLRSTVVIHPNEPAPALLTAEAFGRANSAPNQYYVDLRTPHGFAHEMYQVTLTAVHPDGSNRTDKKTALFGLCFHHDSLAWHEPPNPPYPRFDEVDAAGWNSPPNWFEGFPSPPQENMHWYSLVGLTGFIYKQNLDGSIGAHDYFGGQGGARGQLYIGEQTGSPPHSCHFWEDYYTDWSDSNLGGGDVITYYGMDLVGCTMEHERAHKILWTQSDNWGDDYSDEDIVRAGFPDPNHFNDPDYDDDGDYIRNLYEWNHGWDPRDNTWKGPYHYEQRYSLNMAHNGTQTLPDNDFYAEWWGERGWDTRSKSPQDWSDHGALKARH